MASSKPEQGQGKESESHGFLAKAAFAQNILELIADHPQRGLIADCFENPVGKGRAKLLHRGEKNPDFPTTLEELLMELNLRQSSVDYYLEKASRREQIPPVQLTAEQVALEEELQQAIEARSAKNPRLKNMLKVVQEFTDKFKPEKIPQYKMQREQLRLAIELVNELIDEEV